MEVLDFLFDLGDEILSLISQVGDFFSASLASLSPGFFGRFADLVEAGFVTDGFSVILADVINASIFSLIFGGGIVFMMTYKLIKFFTDIIF